MITKSVKQSSIQSKISALSSGNIDKYKFLTGEAILPKKAATIERLEYSPLGRDLKKQTDIAKKTISRVDKVHQFDKEEGDDETINKEEKDNDKTPLIKKYNKSNLIYKSKHSFYKYTNIKKFVSLSL